MRPDLSWAYRYPFERGCQHALLDVRDIESETSIENGEIVANDVMVSLYCPDCGGVDYSELDLLKDWPRAKRIFAYMRLVGIKEPRRAAR